MSEIVLDPRPTAKSRTSFHSGFRNSAFVLVFFLLSLFVLFHDLGGAALFEPDEGRNAEVGREILLTQDWVTPHYNFIPRLDKPIVYYWLVALSYKLFGVSEWSARLPSAVAALACIFLTYELARTMLGFWEALWSGLILVTSAEFVVLSRAVILDMPLTFFMTVSLCAFYWGRNADGRVVKKVFYLLMYASMGIASLIKGPIGFILPGLVIFFYLFHTKKWSLLRQMSPISGIPLFLIIAISWYGWAEVRNPGYLRYFLWEENILRFLTSGFNRNQPWYYLFLILLFGFIPWTLLISVIIEDLAKGLEEEESLFLLLWTVLPLFFFSFSRSKLPHYILPAYPPLCILAGKSLCRILGDPSGRRSWVFSLPWLTLAAALLVVVLALLRPDLLPDHVQGPVRQFAPVIPLSLVWTTLLIFIVLAFANWRALWKRPGALYLSYCIGFVLVFLLAHRVMAAVSYTRTSKELAEKAAPFIRPEDRIVIHHAYLSSLPFYLRVNRPLWVVWSGQKGRVMGSTYVGEKLPRSAAGHEKALFTYQEFSKLWTESRERLLIFAHAKDVGRMNEQALAPLKTILQAGDVVLVTNR